MEVLPVTPLTLRFNLRGAISSDFGDGGKQRGLGECDLRIGTE